MLEESQIRDGRIAMVNLAEHGLLNDLTVFDLAQMTDAEVAREGAKFAAKVMEPLIDWIKEYWYPAFRQFLDEFGEWWESIPQEVRDSILEGTGDVEDRS